MFFPVATLLLTALSASATIIAPPTIPRALGDVIILQPPQGYVVRAGEAFALHYINKVLYISSADFDRLLTTSQSLLIRLLPMKPRLVCNAPAVTTSAA
jgi:hypothetical protein